MSYAVAPRRHRTLGSASAAGAAVGTAVAGPVGTAVGGFIGGLFHTGSPRYEGGPLLSTVQLRLSQLKGGDPQAIAQTHQDAQSGGAGWKDVALVLAPVVRPDLFAPALRSLTTQEQALVSPFVGAGAVAAAAVTGNQGSPGTPGTPPKTLSAGLNGPLGVILGLGLLGAFLARGRGRRR